MTTINTPSGWARPAPRTGPAGEYDEACRQRANRAAEWFGLDLGDLISFDLSTLTFVAWNARPTPIHGSIGSWNAESLDGNTRYKAQIRLTSRVEEEILLAHIGPAPEPPRFVSIWHARPEDLTPGTKLYDAEGNEVGEVGQSLHGSAMGFFGIAG